MKINQNSNDYKTQKPENIPGFVFFIFFLFPNVILSSFKQLTETTF